jgi:signal transduction histidine kinase
MRRVSTALVLLVPWVVPLAVAILASAPRAPRVLELSGEWAWVEAGDALPSEVSPWRPTTLPGTFARRGIHATDLWLRRDVDVPNPTGGAYTLVLGDTQQAVVRLYVNGEEVGDVGSFEAHQKTDFNGLEAVGVPRRLVRAGRNRVLLRVASAQHSRSGISDGRLLFGPSAELTPWFLRTQRVEAFVRTAPVSVLVLLSLLLLVFARMASERQERTLALLALVAALGSAAYLVLQTGIGVTGLMSLELRAALVPLSVAVALSAFAEFVEALLRRKASGLLRANRWVTGGFVTVYGLAQLGGVGRSFLFWQGYAPWVIVMLGSVAWVMAKGLLVERDRVTALLASSALSVVGAGLTDTLVDLGALPFACPRLLGLVVSNAPIAAGVVVVARFVALAAHNRALTYSLTRSNEELTQALVEAREATRLKSEFLANVSHELRTPLNSIINLPDGLLQDFEQADADGAVRFVGDAASAAHYLESLRRSGRHLLGVVDQVLDLSKREARPTALTTSAIDLAELLADTVRALERLAEKRGIVLTVTGALEVPFVADRVKVAQVLLNLGHNAVKFSPDGGTVAFEVRAEGSFVVITVRDQGIGIAPTHQGLIFESFRQVEGGSARRYGGTGLGLSISRRLTELHGGSLTVTSAVDQGSTFEARFPLVVSGAGP